MKLYQGGYVVKKLYCSLMLLFAMHHIRGCPTCVARTDATTPPFFTDEFYQQPDTPTDDHSITMQGK